MATNVAGRRYQTWYAVLLRLYPRPFREQFGEGMAQTFHDLCREHSDTSRGLFGFALWIFCETLVGIVKENTTHMPVAASLPHPADLEESSGGILFVQLSTGTTERQGTRTFRY